MGRKRKKPGIKVSTQTAVLLAGSAVCVVLLIGVVILVRSSIQFRNRDFQALRDARPAPLARTPEEAWKLLRGKWGRTERSGNSISKVEYEFTDDRRVIFRSKITGGVLPMPQTSQVVNKVIGVELDKDNVLLKVEGGPGEMLLLFESPTVLVMEGEDFRRLD